MGGLELLVTDLSAESSDSLGVSVAWRSSAACSDAMFVGPVMTIGDAFSSDLSTFSSTLISDIGLGLATLLDLRMGVALTVDKVLV